MFLITSIVNARIIAFTMGKQGAGKEIQFVKLSNNARMR